MKLMKMFVTVAATMRLMLAVGCDSSSGSNTPGGTTTDTVTAGDSGGTVAGDDTTVAGDDTTVAGDDTTVAEDDAGGSGVIENACDNEADLAILSDETIDPNAKAKDCMTGPCGPQDIDCLSTCIAEGNTDSGIEGIGLTTNCAHCFGATTACAALNCLMPCLSDPNGDECITCLGDNGCLTDFCACTGPVYGSCIPTE